MFLAPAHHSGDDDQDHQHDDEKMGQPEKWAIGEKLGCIFELAVLRS